MREVCFSGQQCSRNPPTVAGNAVGGQKWLVLRVQSEAEAAITRTSSEYLESLDPFSSRVVLKSCQRPQWNKHKRISEVPVNAHAGWQTVHFSSWLRPSSPLVLLRLCTAVPQLLRDHHAGVRRSYLARRRPSHLEAEAF